jgi:hypothetical protein
MNGEQKNQLPDRELVLTLRKLHRSEQAVEYIKSCQINRVTPSFAQMAKILEKHFTNANYRLRRLLVQKINVL